MAERGYIKMSSSDSSSSSSSSSEEEVEEDPLEFTSDAYFYRPAVAKFKSWDVRDGKSHYMRP